MVTTFQRTRSADKVVVAPEIKSPPSNLGRAFGQWESGSIVRRSAASLRGSAGCCVKVAAPSCLAPSFWIELARIAAAGGAFAFEDEVDPAKVGRGVTVGERRVVVSSGHDAPPVLVVCERGRRVAAPAFLTMAMNCPATRPPRNGGAERECAPGRSADVRRRDARFRPSSGCRDRLPALVRGNHPPLQWLHPLLRSSRPMRRRCRR